MPQIIPGTECWFTNSSPRNPYREEVLERLKGKYSAQYDGEHAREKRDWRYEQQRSIFVSNSIHRHIDRDTNGLYEEPVHEYPRPEEGP